jgi:ethanolamine utilization microcompartment shell protein EutL
MIATPTATEGGNASKTAIAAIIAFGGTATCGATGADDDSMAFGTHLQQRAAHIRQHTTRAAATAASSIVIAAPITAAPAACDDEVFGEEAEVEREVAVGAQAWGDKVGAAGAVEGNRRRVGWQGER